MPIEQDIISIKQLTQYIKMRLESDPRLADLWVRGEISNFTHHASGHMYFTLKDKDSRIKCIMFASYNQKLPFIPREGTRVLAHGHVSIYDRDGQYQLYITQMQPDGIGSLYLAFEQLKRKLESEGLFDVAHKQPIPRYPKVIGVITSPTGAAIRDIITTLTRRYPAASILLYPVLVQGGQAAPAIAKAIETMNRNREADVLIVGRGGGSLEELWAFNEEAVARSIYASQIPVISAVGHETDFTIADFAADLRAATPTAAAELAVPHHLELRQQIAFHTQQLHKGLLTRLQYERARLTRLLRSPALTQPRRNLLQPIERLDRLTEQLRHRMEQSLGQERQIVLRLTHRLASRNPREHTLQTRARVDQAKRELLQMMQGSVKEARHRLLTQMKQLDALSPLKVMQRGYSLVYDEKEHKLIKSIRQVQPGDLLRIRLTDGTVEGPVWSILGEDELNGTNR